MKVYGELGAANFEQRTSDWASGVAGRVWWRTDLTKAMVDDGTNIRALLRNDGFCVFGNSGTAANNIRFHRGANGVLQLVSGADITAEGTLSTALNQLSQRIESYTNSGKPAFGNSGRIIWVTDIPELEIDSGSAWISITVGGRVNALYDFVVGTAGQVASGIATHSTWASAIAAASAGNTIKILEGSWTENPTVNKQLYIEGCGNNSLLTGTITFATSSDRSYLRNIRTTQSIVYNSGVTLCKADGIWLASGKTFTNNGTGNLLEGMQDT